jgi:DNA-directed RNA polymerase specialized sigma24 family protein
MTEASVLEDIEHVVRVVCGTFGFGYYDAEDIQQEARLLALRALPKYEPSRGSLRDFLWTAVRTRLLNLQRDKFMRPTPPCPRCHAGDFCSEGGVGDPPTVCSRYAQWVRLNTAKAGLMQPAGWSEATDSRHADFSAPALWEGLQDKEVWERIDRELPAHLRGDFLKLKEGAHISRARQRVVLEAIRGILGLAELEDEGQP